MQNQLRQTKELQAQQKQLNEQIQRELAAQQSMQQQLKSASSAPLNSSISLAFTFSTSIVGRGECSIINIINSW